MKVILELGDGNVSDLSQAHFSISSADNSFIFGISIFSLLKYNTQAIDKLIIFEKETDTPQQKMNTTQYFLKLSYIYFAAEPRELKGSEYCFRYKDFVVHFTKSEFISGIVYCINQADALDIPFDQNISILNPLNLGKFEVIKRTTFLRWDWELKNPWYGKFNKLDNRTLNNIWVDLTNKRDSYSKSEFVKQIIKFMKNSFIDEHKYDYDFYSFFVPIIVETKDIITYNSYLQKLNTNIYFNLYSEFKSLDI